jgi:hypothetical protein
VALGLNSFKQDAANASNWAETGQSRKEKGFA